MRYLVIKHVPSRAWRNQGHEEGQKGRSEPPLNRRWGGKGNRERERPSTVLPISRGPRFGDSDDDSEPRAGPEPAKCPVNSDSLETLQVSCFRCQLGKCFLNIFIVTEDIFFIAFRERGTRTEAGVLTGKRTHNPSARGQPSDRATPGLEQGFLTASPCEGAGGCEDRVHSPRSC